MISVTDKGMYCEAGGFHIDPTRRVEIALITHAHSDHARKGHQHYYCVKSGINLLAHRVGQKAKITGVAYGELLRFGNVAVSFHPAGHILGSAQIRIEHEGRVWVISGDYKRDSDPTCEPFEVIPCDTFITEATFGHPEYQWGDTSDTVAQIHEWWEGNRSKKRNSLLYCYALGKSQRVLAELARHTDRRVLVFGETADMTEFYRREGVPLCPTDRLEHLAAGTSLEGELIIAPSSISRTPWIEKLSPVETAFASGWMRTGAFGMSSRYDRGFVLSDHADWNSLVQTARETGARQVLIQHPQTGRALVSHLKKLGVKASILTPDTAQKAALDQRQGELFG